MKTARKIAIAVMNEFEEFLARKGIVVPSKDREGNPEEACLYGSEYYQMEDAITDIIEARAGKLLERLRT